jgi:hypothetical protein
MNQTGVTAGLFFAGNAMKTITAAFFLIACLTADAATLAAAFNDRGGLIELTDEPCDAQSNRASTSEENGTGKEYGCYIVRDGRVHIYWYALDRVLTYPVDFIRPLASS